MNSSAPARLDRRALLLAAPTALAASLLHTSTGFAADAGPTGAADDEKKLTVPLGNGKTVEMPDTSDAARGLDLSAVKLDLRYEADFTRPLKVVREADLFAGGKRTPPPAGTDWVLEGKADAAVTGGKLVLTNDTGHLVLWNTRAFPADLLVEFTVAPADPKKGLGILFFAASGKDGGGIFDAGQPLRDGVFKAYHSGALRCYHASYWATDADGAGRGTAHVRKNPGFHLGPPAGTSSPTPAPARTASGCSGGRARSPSR